jgi:dTDP-4-amino-4,6-dideoxygalactose transaminase
MQSCLKAAGIGSGIHYPIPLHLQNAYRELGYQKGDFPVCERVASEILSLPMYPQLSRPQQEKVAHAVKESLAVLSSAS